ncbi:hypothetical protein PENTCL1PPCAC_13976, partial [Pristionchus entomophagus]
LHLGNGTVYVAVEGGAWDVLHHYVPHISIIDDLLVVERDGHRQPIGHRRSEERVEETLGVVAPSQRRVDDVVVEAARDEVACDCLQFLGAGELVDDLG